jgi:hypothetical protein
MTATIGELSFFETLLGARVVQSLPNEDQFQISALQRDLAIPKNDLKCMKVTRERTDGKNVIEIWLTPGRQLSAAGAIATLKAYYPALSTIIDEKLIRGEEYDPAVPEKVCAFGYKLSVKIADIVVGIKTELVPDSKGQAPAEVSALGVQVDDINDDVATPAPVFKLDMDAISAQAMKGSPEAGQ